MSWSDSAATALAATNATRNPVITTKIINRSALEIRGGTGEVDRDIDFSAPMYMSSLRIRSR